MVPYDWVISFKPGPVLLGLVFKGESCDSGRGWNSHLTQVRKVVVTLDLLSSYLGAGSLACSSVPEETVHHVQTSVSGALSGPCWTWAMFGSGHLVSPLSSAVFHSSAAHLFPPFPSRLTSPQIFIPGPLLSYELLRRYLPPEPCKQALLLAAQSTGQHAENIGEPILLMTS